MTKTIKLWKVGRINYLKSVKLQEYLSSLHHKSSENHDTLLCVEHPPVYTTGIRNKQYPPEEEHKLKQTGAEFHRTNRGGLITFHGPGQLVVYPIINLKNFTPKIGWYVCHIEKTIIDLCKKYGLKGETSPNTGVWIGDNKICSIGIHGSRFVTTHGLALNCSTDLKWFDHIVPCGIEGKGVTSLSKELGKEINVEEIIPKFLDSFSEIFKCSFAEFPKEETKHIIENVIK